MRNPIATDKPEPLVPFSRIRAVRERMDHDGVVLHELDPAAVRTAIAQLKDATRTVEVIGACGDVACVPTCQT